MKKLLIMLTIATALNSIGIAYLIFREEAPNTTANSLVSYVSERASDLESYNSFHDRPLHEKISQASVIFSMRYEPQGDKMIGVVDRILKKSSDIVFYYEEGDHYAGSDFTPEENVSHGEGMVHFCLGNPATVVSGSSIHNGRIPGLGDIPINDFIKMVEQRN